MTKDLAEIVVDSFAGGGGASDGLEAAGIRVDIAINHDEKAIAMHRANHPRTDHYPEDIWKVNPRKVTRGQPVGLLWASPDCKGFSRAKGGKPVEKNIRSLAWVVVKWAAECPPRVIILENVREFEEWGPLVPRWRCRECDWKGAEGQAVLLRKRRRCPRCDSLNLKMTVGKDGKPEMIPDPHRKGITFKRFVGRLRGHGYQVEWRVLNAADYGAATHRRRLFLVARNDGEPIIWPEPTHGDPAKIARGETDLFSTPKQPWRTAAECIDWTLPCPSIFLTREEAGAWGKDHGCASPKRPLEEKTLRRIALGIKRYVLDNPRPFIVDMQRDNRGRTFDEPLGTVTTQGNRFNLVTPIVTPLTHHGERRSNSPAEPLPTITGANRGEQAVVAPLLARIGQTGGNGKYCNGPLEPLTTITTKAEHLCVAAFLSKYHGQKGNESRCRPVDGPANTIDAQPRFSLVSAFLAKHYGGVVGHGPDRPIGTVTAWDHHSVVAANLVHLKNNTQPTSPNEPLHTILAGGTHAALVYSFLVKYFGTAIGQELEAPLGTVTTKHRYGVVTLTIDGELFILVDIGMRMLTPRELFRCQGFADSYILTGSTTSQVARCGNSVPPVMAKVLAGANYNARVMAA